MTFLAVAIAYVMQKTPYVFPIIGGRKVEHLHANIEALDITLSEEHIEEIESAHPFDVGFPHNMVVSSTLAPDHCVTDRVKFRVTGRGTHHCTNLQATLRSGLSSKQSSRRWQASSRNVIEVYTSSVSTHVDGSVTHSLIVKPVYYPCKPFTGRH